MTLLLDILPSGPSIETYDLAAGLGGPAQEASSASALAAAASAFGEAGVLLSGEHIEGLHGRRGCTQEHVELTPLCAAVGCEGVAWRTRVR